MFKDLSKIKIFVRPGATDLRKQMAGLSAVVQNCLEENPFSGNLFLFCNRRRNLLKVLYWDLNGFCCWQKRLEKDRFSWPRDEDATRQITKRDLQLLLEGLDIWNAHKALHYTEVA
jgi:transposase